MAMFVNFKTICSFPFAGQSRQHQDIKVIKAHIYNTPVSGLMPLIRIPKTKKPTTTDVFVMLSPDANEPRREAVKFGCLQRNTATHNNKEQTRIDIGYLQ